MSEYAKTWMVDRSAKGSVYEVTVSQRDQTGRALKITGSLYCSNYPTLRVSPDRRVIAAYASGSYRE